MSRRTLGPPIYPAVPLTHQYSGGTLHKQDIQKVGPKENHQTAKVSLAKQQELIRYTGMMNIPPPSGSGETTLRKLLLVNLRILAILSDPQERREHNTLLSHLSVSNIET